MAIVGKRPSAGRSALEIHKRGVKSWRRGKVMRRVRLIAFPVLLASSLAGPHLPSFWAWLAGVAGGAFGGLWLWLRDDVPEDVDYWRQGAHGEIQTAQALASLGAEWHVRHDLQAGRGNLDHVVVGPGGVFLLDSKNLDGKAFLRGPGLVVERPSKGRYDTELGPRARRQAKALNAELARAGGLNRWVQPVIVFWNDFPQRTVEHDGVTYVDGAHLREWLIGRPPRMDEDELGRMRRAVAGMTPARVETLPTAR